MQLLSALLDPNVAYFALLIALWTGTMAVYMPGTGLVEIIALLAVGLALYLLFNLPTNLLGVTLIVAGALVFLATPLRRPSRTWHPTVITAIGIGLQAIGGLLLFNGINVSWFIILVMLIVSLIFYQYILMPMIRLSVQPAVTDQLRTLLGARGRVVASIDPVGAIHVNGETWTAVSQQRLQIGDEVIVLAKDGLRLQVEAYQQPVASRSTTHSS